MEIMKPFFWIFGSKFELHHKITWLVDYLLPWQPYKKSFLISWRNVYMYLHLKYEHKSTYGYWVMATPVFSQSEALYGYHGNQWK